MNCHNCLDNEVTHPKIPLCIKCLDKFCSLCYYSKHEIIATTSCNGHSFTQNTKRNRFMEDKEFTSGINFNG